MSFETVPIFTNPPGLNQGLCGYWEVTGALVSAAGLQLISSTGHTAWVSAAHLAGIPDQSTTCWGCESKMSPRYAKAAILTDTKISQMPSKLKVITRRWRARLLGWEWQEKSVGWVFKGSVPQSQARTPKGAPPEILSTTELGDFSLFWGMKGANFTNTERYTVFSSHILVNISHGKRRNWRGWAEVHETPWSTKLEGRGEKKNKKKN